MPGCAVLCPHVRPYRAVMDNDTAPSLRSTELAALLGVNERRARQILGELEALGFNLETAQYGARCVPAGLAAAVKLARTEGRELASLRVDDSLRSYLKADRQGAELDPLTLLVEGRAEVAVLREVVGALFQSLSQGSQRLGYKAPQSWAFIGVPDPRRGL
jgi:hypothetical protein